MVEQRRPDDRPGQRFARVVISSGASNLADGVARVALPIVAAASTRSPALVAGIELVRTIPWLFGALPVGALVDRLDRRSTLVVANLVRSSLVGALALVAAGGQAALWLLYAVAIGSGIAEVFYDTAAQSMVPSIVERSRLDRANGQLYAVEVGAQELLGPPAAGILVAASAVLAFATSTALWVLAVVVLITVRGRFRPVRSGPSSLRADVAEGVRFLLHRPMLRTMALMVGMSNLASSAVFAVLVLHAVGPTSAMGLTEAQFGLLFAMFAVGGLVGGLVAETVERRIGRARTLTSTVLGTSAYVVTLALTADPLAVGVAAFVSGTTVMMWNVVTVTYRQRVTPDHLLGRLNSAYRLVAWGTRPLGALIGGAIGQWYGVRAVFVAMAALALAVLVPNRLITDAALAAEEREPIEAT